MHWILQNKVFGGELYNLINAIDKAGHSYTVCDTPTVACDPPFQVFRGSTHFVQSCMSHIPIYKTIPFNLSFFSSKNYYHLLDDKDILNSFHVFMTWGQFKKTGKKIFESDKLFIRPDSGEKIFTGTTIGKKWFEKECGVIETLPSTSNLNDKTLIMVAPCQKIVYEARFLLSPIDVVDGSWYNSVGTEGHFAQMLSIAQKYVKIFKQFLTMDFAVLEDGSIKIVEINSFQCAGLYDMSMDKVVKSVSDYVQKGAPW